MAIEAAKWAWALEVLGFKVVTIAGEGTADRLISGLAIHAPSPPESSEVTDALADAELVVVENLCSLPLNEAAASVVAGVLKGRRTILHHHDLPWQRPEYALHPPPPDDPNWAHVTINELSRRQLGAHRIDATVVRNTFDVDARGGERDRTRAALDVTPEQSLVLQPTRALARKNVAGGIALAEDIKGVFWLLGPAEDGFGPELDRLVSRAQCECLLGPPPEADGWSTADAYAACDVVALPSTWEGFGNPAVESAVYRRPLAIGAYPVAAELEAFGFLWFSARNGAAVASFLDRPDPGLLEHNHRIARQHFALGLLPDRIGRVIEATGWSFP